VTRTQTLAILLLAAAAGACQRAPEPSAAPHGSFPADAPLWRTPPPNVTPSVAAEAATERLDLGRQARLSVPLDRFRREFAGNPKLLIIDASAARPSVRLPKATSVPREVVDTWAASMPKSTPIVAYCGCPNDESSSEVVFRLRDLGFTNAWILQGGLRAWVEAGLPTDRVDGPY